MLPVQHGKRNDRRLRRVGRQDRGGRAAVCVGMCATPIAAARTSGVVLIGDRRVDRTIVMRVTGLGLIHLRVHEIVRMRELGRMQDRHLAAAEHGNGEQGCDHDVFDDATHALTKACRSGCVKPPAVG